MNKIYYIFLLIVLTICFIPMRVKAQETINEGQLISASMTANQFKAYHLSETLSKGSLIVLSVKRIRGYGTFTLQKGLQKIGEYYVSSYTSSYPLKFCFYPFVIPEDGSTYLFNVSSSSEGFEFSFFYDISDALGSQNSKSILIEGGAVAYYADLDQGEMLSLTLTPPQGAEFDLLILPNLLLGGYYGVFPSIVSTFFMPSPKNTSFVADAKMRYIILVVSTSGTGNFTLLATHSNNPIEESLEILKTKFDTLSGVVYFLTAISCVSLIIVVIIALLYLRLKKSVGHNYSPSTGQLEK